MPSNSKGFDYFLPHGGQEHAGMFTPKKRQRPMKKQSRPTLGKMGDSNFVESGLQKGNPNAAKNPLDGTAASTKTPAKPRIDIDFNPDAK